VRRLLGVGFVGASYDTHIMLADVRLSEELETAVNAYVGRDGLALLPAFGDVWYRAVIWDRRREHVPLEVPVGIEEVRESLRRIAGVDLKVVEMRWSTRFLSERRQAERYRVGRVFLAGDVAHVHSPLGALGMNTGIQTRRPQLEVRCRSQRLGAALVARLLPGRAASRRARGSACHGSPTAPDGGTARSARSAPHPGASRARGQTATERPAPTDFRSVHCLPAAARPASAPLDGTAGAGRQPRRGPPVRAAAWRPLHPPRSYR
jgi:hypothetical protein